MPNRGIINHTDKRQIREPVRPFIKIDICSPKPLSMPLKITFRYIKGQRKLNIKRISPIVSSPYIRELISPGRVKNKAAAPKPVTVAKSTDFSEVVFIALVFFAAQLSEIAGTIVMETAVKKDEGNIIRGIAIPDSFPNSLTAAVFERPKTSRREGISMFSAAERREDIRRLRVRGITIAKISLQAEVRLRPFKALFLSAPVKRLINM